MSRRAAIELTVLAAIGASIALLLSSGPSRESRAGGYYPGQAGQVAAPDGITVVGVGHVRVRRPARRSDETIRLAVAAAQRAAFPKAAADAREHSKVLANSLGLTLGSAEAVSEGEDMYTSGVFGRFGAGRYCGVLVHRIFDSNAVGDRVVRRVVRHHTCIVPKESVVQLTVRYEKG
jgi:hypothetical protein